MNQCLQISALFADIHYVFGADQVVSDRIPNGFVEFDIAGHVEDHRYVIDQSLIVCLLKLFKFTLLYIFVNLFSRFYSADYNRAEYLFSVTHLSRF